MTELQVRKIGKAYEIALNERPIRVGRSSANDIVLRSERVSREHCIIELIDGHPRLRDLNSRHGTLVNGRKITETPIRPGDRIGVGGYEIAFDGLLATSTPTLPAEDASAPTDDDPALIERERLLAEREQTLIERERLLTEREQALTEGDLALDDRQQKLDADRVVLTDDRTTLDEDRRTLDEQRTLHDQAREALAGREADLEQRERALAGEREAMETEHRVLIERDAERALEIERMTKSVAESGAVADTEKARADKLAVDLAAVRTALETAQRETRSVTERLAETEADNESIRKQAAHLSRQLERKSKDLTKTIDRGAALETALAKAEAARQVLSAQAGKAEALEAAGRAVVAASDYLALVRQSVVGIESQWIETDEIVNESQERGQVDAFQAMQREELSRQLEYAHEERDNAMSDLQEAVARLSEAITFGRGSIASRRRNLLSR